MQQRAVTGLLRMLERDIGQGQRFNVGLVLDTLDVLNGIFALSRKRKITPHITMHHLIGIHQPCPCISHLRESVVLFLRHSTPTLIYTHTLASTHTRIYIYTHTRKHTHTRIYIYTYTQIIRVCTCAASKTDQAR